MRFGGRWSSSFTMHHDRCVWVSCPPFPPPPRCGPCQFLLPVLDELAARYEGRLRILKVDTESEPELASALAIRGLPTLCFVRDGALKYRMEGALAADELAQIIDQILL